MKIFTLLSFCLFPFFCTAISAKPMRATFSVSADTLYAEAIIKAKDCDKSLSPAPDTVTDNPTGSLSPTVIVINDFCGQGSGSIDITPDPNTPGPWTYHWSNLETTQDLTGLTGGTYTVTIADANGDVQIEEVVVNTFGLIVPPMANAVVTGNTVCVGAYTGALDITVIPLTGPWTYLWSTGATTQDVTGLNHGTYTVSVTVGVTCTTIFEFTVPDNAGGLIANIPPPGFAVSTCEREDGATGVIAVGGMGPYTYLWSNGVTTSGNQNIFADTYTVTITDANGCTATNSVTVGNVNYNMMIEGVVNVPNTTCIGANGSIDLLIVHPIVLAPSFTYLWSNGATTQDLTNVPSGTYFVTVSINHACFLVEGYYIEHEPAFPVVVFNNTNASCGLGNGFVNLTTLPGGTPPYTYLWSNGATTQDIFNVPAGDYEVTITGTNGCTFTQNATIDDVPILFGYSALVTDQSACDTTNGQIELSLFPSNLAYQWSNGATTKTLKNLAPGNYTVTISAGGTCTAVETYNVGDVTEYPSIPALVDTSSCGLANGAIDLFVLGNATAPFTYIWSNGATTEDLTGILSDTFYVTVTSAVGCSNTNMVIVPNRNDTIRVQGSLSDNISCASPTGNIALSITPIDSNYTFLWSNGMTTDSLSNLAGGDYLVTVTLGLTCIALDTFSVANTALPPNLSASGTPTNCDFSNGAIDLNVSGGSGPFTFLWSNAATTEDLSALPPGTYSVTVTGANSCTEVIAATVPNNNVALGVSGTPVENTSCAAPNGSLNISVSPAGTYNYIWSNSATTEDLSNLPVGSYTVTVSLGTCLSSATFSVLDNALPPNLSASGSPASCGFGNGSADLGVSGGSGPFTFLWSNAATTEDLSNLPPGSYTVTVTGANACTSLGTADVLNNNIALNVNALPVGNSSCTTANGAIDVTVTPIGSYTYLWSNATTGEDLNNLADGVYTVTVTLGTCQSSNTFSVADNTATPLLSSNITASICSVNNGAIDLSVSGTAGPYAYLWSNLATTEDLSGILPGNYSVTVTAPNGCTEIATLNVPNNASNFSLAATAAALTNCALNNGAIDLNITPVGAYTYAWSNAATTQDLSGLAPGTYTVSVTESGSCTATASYFVIDQRISPITSQSIAPEICGLADGSIDLGVSGGTAPFDYLWASGQTSEDLTNIAAGAYAVTVTDANSCTATALATVPGNSISFSLAGTPSSNSSCTQNNGAVDLTVNPSGGVTYLWSNLSTTEDLNGLNAGTYTVTVSAGGNCTNTAAFTIVNDLPSPLLSQNITAASCGQASGGIDLSVSGSPAPYLFLWSTSATTEDLAGITSNTYSVTVTAANGCTTTQSLAVPENTVVPSIGSVLTQSTSCTVNNGAIDLTITPSSVSGYTFLWSNAATTEDQSNIAAGTYTVTVNGGGACTNTASLTVGSTVPLPSLSDNIAAATCGQASGSIDLTVTGSVGPYQFAWSNAATTEDLANTISGAFTVTVTAANGCSTIANFTIPENVILPIINGTPTAATSCISNNGAIDLTLGPPPVGGYIFTWSNAATSEDLANLPAGSYTVTVNSGGACISTASFSVASNAPSPALSNNISAATCGQSSGGIDLSVTGSPTPYQYIWSNAATTEDLANVASGDFTVTVTAANGCTTLGNFTVPENVVLPVINGVPTADNSCLLDNGAVDLTVGPAPGYSFVWSNAATTEDLSNLATGSYTVTVNGGGACTATASFTIANQTTQPLANIASNTTTLDCITTIIALNGSVAGTPNPVSFQWSANGIPLGSGSILSVTAPGQYELLLTDDVTSCTATASILVSQNLNLPPIAVANPGQLTCTSPSQTLTGISTVLGIQFAWATINGTDTTILGNGATLSVSAAGTYYLIGTNPANNCANATPVNVTADMTAPIADAGNPFTLDCAGETAGLNGSGSGASNLAYQWMSQDGHFVSGAMTANPLIDKAGTYQLLVTNPANGCTDTDVVTIAPEVPMAFTSVQQPTCLNLLGAVRVDSVTGLSDPILYSLNGSQPGAQDQFQNLTPGTYTLDVSGGNGCSAASTVVVEAPDLVEISLVPTATINLGYTYQIDATLNIPDTEIASVSWTPVTGLVCDTCLSTEAKPFSTTQYEVLVVSKAGCEARGNLLLTVDKTRKIYGPNIFSPDGDGTNDVFTVFADPFAVVKIKSLQVYSRWGEEVFEQLDFTAGDIATGWDGTFKGQKLNPAVFVWQAVVEFVDGKEELFMGDVTLQR